MADVVDAAGREVVEDEHLVAAADVGVGQMRPDKTRAAGDQNAHETIIPRVASNQQTIIQYN